MPSFITVKQPMGVPLITREIYDEICVHIGRMANDPSQVANQMCEIPTVYAYYYGIMIRLKRLLDDAEDGFEEFKAAARTEKRAEGAKLTAVAGEDYVNSLEGSQGFTSDIRHLRETYGYAKGICNTLDMKKDMLIQLSANSRQESKLYQ
tara:strand:+ start:954 stop:1403 length:450 start_codon:yes stop_codon:yes gene_type:complete